MNAHAVDTRAVDLAIVTARGHILSAEQALERARAEVRKLEARRDEIAADCAATRDARKFGEGK
jgi:hypothetical protein